MPRHLAVALACIALSLVAITSAAQAPPSADTYVTSAMPTANFGSSPILAVQQGTTSYVKLDLGALPANASVVKATLRLYVDAVAAPGSFHVFQVNSSWSEPGATYNSAPPLGASVTGDHPVGVTATSVNQFVLVDITPLVQGWLNGSIPNNGLALASTGSGGSFSFDSKESTGTGHHPELDVVLGSSTPLAVSGLRGPPLRR